MATIGNKALQTPLTYIQCYIQIAFDGITSTFQLYDAVTGGNIVSLGSAENLEVILAGVRQQPQTDYTVSAAGITFVGAAPTAGTNFFAIRQAQVQEIPGPGAGTVGTTQLVDNAVTSNKILDNAVTFTKLSASTETSVSSSNLLVPTSGAVQTYTASQLLAERQSWPYMIGNGNYTGGTYVNGSPIEVFIDNSNLITKPGFYLNLPANFTYLLTCYGRFTLGSSTTDIGLRFWDNTNSVYFGSTGDNIPTTWTTNSTSNLETCRGIMSTYGGSKDVGVAIEFQSGTKATNVYAYVTIQVIG